VIATSHGEGGGAGGAGGALVAISAASADVVRPATISNGKATRFITDPSLIPCRQTDGFDASTGKPIFCDNPRSPDCAQLETPQVFQFCDGTAKTKSRASAAFLCFRWKTLYFVKKCGGWDTVRLREPYSLSPAFLFTPDTCCMPKDLEPI
jgi:hypothetical protein